MAGIRLPAITNEVTTLADGDWFYVVDISDPSDHASGSSAKITKANVAATLGGTSDPLDGNAIIAQRIFIGR